MSKKKKPPLPIVKSVTSLQSVRSLEDDDEPLEESLETPKSQISLRSIKSLDSSDSKGKQKKSKRKEKRKAKGLKEGRKSPPGSVEDKSRSNEPEKVTGQSPGNPKNPKDSAKVHGKQPKCQMPTLQMPVLFTGKRSADPPPTVEENACLDRFTPSEINLYLDSEKDLAETAITKKQQTTVLESLKMPCRKLSAPKPKENDQSSEVSSNELDNLIFTDSDKGPPESGKASASVSFDQLQVRRGTDEETKIAKEISARFENLIMDPSIFEKAAEAAQQQPAISQRTSSVGQVDAASSPTEPNQLAVTPPPISLATAAPARGQQAVPSTSAAVGGLVPPPVEPVPKEIKFDNAVVLFSYKKAKKARKKKKKKKRTEIRIGLIGAGKMTEAIVNTLLNSLNFSPNLIYVASPSGRNLEMFKAKGCQTTKRNIDLFTRYFCHIIFINVFGGVIRYCYKLGGVKPFPLTISFVPATRHRYYLFSLVSGVSLEEIRDVIFNSDQLDKYQFEMHRVLLNVSCVTKTSICAIDCEISQLSPVIKVFLEKFGELEYIPDREMDAACAIAGSGAAFTYYFLNAISDGSVKIGMSKEKSIRLVSQIVNSSLEYLNRAQDVDQFHQAFTQLFNEQAPALVGLDSLRKQNVAAGIEAGIVAAYNRILELATMEITPQFSSG